MGSDGLDDILKVSKLQVRSKGGSRSLLFVYHRGRIGFRIKEFRFKG